jgi:hypothetical protein
VLGVDRRTGAVERDVLGVDRRTGAVERDGLGVDLVDVVLRRSTVPVLGVVDGRVTVLRCVVGVVERRVVVPWRTVTGSIT